MRHTGPRFDVPVRVDHATVTGWDPVTRRVVVRTDRHGHLVAAGVGVILPGGLHVPRVGERLEVTYVPGPSGDVEHTAVRASWLSLP